MFSILTYFAGLSGLASSISIPDSSHALKVSIAIFGAICVMSGQAVRVFYNQTSTQIAIVADTTTHGDVAVDVASHPKGPTL